jgi:uncharacterized protein (DUF433 family)
MPTLRPEDWKTLLSYVARPRRPTARMRAEALLGWEQGRSLEEIAEYVGIKLVDLRDLSARYNEGGLEAVGLSGTSPLQERPRRQARQPTIVKTLGVCGGAARVDGTRIPVWQLVEERDLGASEAQLLNSYRTLTARDLVAAWDYAEAHPEEIAAEIRRNEMVS